MDFDSVVHARRAIRKFQRKAVEKSVLLSVLDLARHAPSSMNGQPWEFVVVEERATLLKLGRIKDKYCPPDKRAFPATMYETAPVAVIVCVDKRESHNRELENALLATSHIMLAAASKGLGTVYQSAISPKQPELSRDIRELFAVPEDSLPVTIIPMGYPDEVPAPRDLKPLTIYRERHGEAAQ